MNKFIKKNGKTKELNPAVARVLIKVKHSLKILTTWMQGKTNHLSPLTLSVALFIFCAVFVCECIFVVYQSFKTEDHISFHVTPIRSVPLPEKRDRSLLISETQFKRIHQFKIYIDSIGATNKSQFDSILIMRPHLLDTINYLENLYYEQQANRK